jgi:hypothetical protein
VCQIGELLVPVPRAADTRAVIDALCTDGTEGQRAELLGISRSSYYQYLKRLAEENILWKPGRLVPGMQVTDGVLTRAILVTWNNWAVQSVNLARWTDRSKTSDQVIVVRLHNTLGNIVNQGAFVVPTKNRWTTRDTLKLLDAWGLDFESLTAMTVAIAMSIGEAEVLVIPEDML